MLFLNKLLFIAPESWSNGSDVPVQAAFRSSNTQRQRSLQDGGENLHLVSTAVLGNLESLHQELEGKQGELKQLSSFHFQQEKSTFLKCKTAKFQKRNGELKLTSIQRKWGRTSGAQGVG